jgi:hypothetical protein
MKPKSGMVSRKHDRGASWMRWYRTRKSHLLEISGEPPKHLCRDQLNLTICCRYSETLFANERVLRYLNKYHPVRLSKLRGVLGEYKETCLS